MKTPGRASFIQELVPFTTAATPRAFTSRPPYSYGNEAREDEGLLKSVHSHPAAA
jgi:hypothetical protein